MLGKQFRRSSILCVGGENARGIQFSGKRLIRNLCETIVKDVKKRHCRSVYPVFEVR